MAKRRAGSGAARGGSGSRQPLTSFKLKGTTKDVRVGSCVLMRPPDKGLLPYVAKVDAIEQDERKNVAVSVRWYYRPEESAGGRRQFHGAQELFLSDHHDVCTGDSIESLCTVHTFRNYTKLKSVGPTDFFCRFEYKASSGTFSPNRVAVYCLCEMPYNPDDLMMQCENCKDWFHPQCLEITPQEAKKLSLYICPECTEKGTRSIAVGNGTQNHNPKDESSELTSLTKVPIAGDSVLLRPDKKGALSYVAQVERIEGPPSDGVGGGGGGGSVRLYCRWYYRPEEAQCGRRSFHGAKELFLSDHFDRAHPDAEESTCNVHSFADYVRLEAVKPEDFYCRLEYRAQTGAFIPDRIPVFCKCAMPYNPDDAMYHCSVCNEWYHPRCLQLKKDIEADDDVPFVGGYFPRLLY
eukprot:SM000324S12599  [mRNA]  locus=s324:81984:86931:- [translate_table: standard]